MAEITPSEVDALVAGESEWALFDVREAGEADAGHIFGASFLPRRQIELRIGDLVADKATRIVLYDEGGPRAELAAVTLARLGYTNVHVLQGGTQAWIAAGRELIQGSNVPSKLFGEEVSEHEHVPQLPVTELKAWREEGRPHLICDIRTPDEYEASRIPQARGAFGVDLARVAGDLREVGMPVVVHCAGRTRSIIACQTLRALGVGEVYALENGTMGWQLAGLKLETGAASGELVPTSSSLAYGERQTRVLAASVGVETVSAAELEALMEARTHGRQNLYVFDVRQLAAFVDGHIDGAIALPGGLAIQRADEFMPVRSACTVLVDSGEARAFLAAYWLRRMGHTHVRVLRGGTVAWQESGRALVKGRGRSRPKGPKADAIVPRVGPAWLAIEPGALIINVDTSRYFSKARVPGSRWIPYGWLEVQIARHAPDSHARILLTCHDGMLSGYAALNLARLGYSDVSVLDGGVDAWASQGHPVDSGWPSDQAPAADLVVPPYRASLASMAAYLEWEQKLTAKRCQVVSNS